MSKYTHLERLCEAWRGRGRKWFHGDAIDEGGDDPNPSSGGGDGEDLGEALELEVEVKEEVVKANVLVKRSEKREWNEKEKIK